MPTRLGELMTPESWQVVLETFEAVVQLPPEERRGYLREQTAGRNDLQREVRSLLASHDVMMSETPEGFLEEPAFSLVSRENDEIEFPEIDSYEILDLLGRGGMGTVYLARRREGDRRPLVALKVLDRHAASESFVLRFRLERAILSELDDPRIASFLGSGTTKDERPYLAMEYFEGERLDRYCARQDLSLEKRLELAAEVCDVVAAAHRAMVVHRDLKPANILVGEDGALKLLDFGVARSLQSTEEEEPALRTEPGGLPFTAEYASPEHVTGVPTSPASDVYSLGVILYELVTGERPLRVEGLPPHELARILADRHPPPPSRRLLRSDGKERTGCTFEWRLDRVILQCLRKEPEERYSTAGELADDLRALVSGGELLARGRESLYRARRHLRRHRKVALGALVLLLAFLAMGVVWLLREIEARERTVLALHFGQKGEQIEAISRSMALQPGHTADEQREVVRRRIEEIQREMEALGRSGRGAAHYALGRGYLSLRDFDQAREHLETAWRLGFRTPDAASLLGRVLGELYRQELAPLDHMADAAERERRRKKIESELRDPALKYLRRGLEADSERSRYLAALMPFYEGDLEEAELRAAEVLERAPWLYEAKLLQADIQLERARSMMKGSYLEDALPLFETARRDYEEVEAIAPSESMAHAGECEAWLGVVRVQAELERLDDENAHEADVACRRALSFDDRPELNVHLAIVLRYRAEHVLLRGGSPSRDLERALHHARRAIELEPDSSQAFGELGLVYRTLARSHYRNGENPDRAIARAQKALKTALELDPESAILHNALGGTALYRCVWEIWAGEDPRASIAQAIDQFEAATELSPTYLAPRMNLASTYGQMGYWLLKSGRSPENSLTQATQLFRQVLEKFGPAAPVLNNLGNTLLGLGKFYYLSGRDPRPVLHDAAESYRQATELAPEYYLPWNHLGMVYRIEAEFLHSRGNDASRAIEASLASLERARELNRSFFGTASEIASTLLVKSRGLADGTSAAKVLADAEAAARRGLEINSEGVNLHAILSEILLEKGRVEGAAGGAGRRDAARSALQSSLAELETVRRLDSTRSDPIMLEALVRLELCQLERTSCADAQAAVDRATEEASANSPLRRRIYERWRRAALGPESPSRSSE